jgi:hypothetical protein
MLGTRLPQTGRALEIASGSGQHVAVFAKSFPGIQWVPSDLDELARDSISAWCDHTALENIGTPLNLDVSREGWQGGIDGPFDVLLAINLVHIAPWAVAVGLLRGAGELLVKGGQLFLYGPYRKDGAHTAQSNARFEEWLKDQNEEWGVRDMGEVERTAEQFGLHLGEAIEMPANNFSLIFRKA